jgi:hypothetical protein
LRRYTGDMTRAARWWRNLLERHLGRFYEGPEPPRRLAEMVLQFAELYPRATKQQWIEFAARHAIECYRTGYVRGYEWCERDLVRRDPAVEPEELLRGQGDDGSWLDHAVDLGDTAAPVQDEPQEDRVDQDLADHYDRAREYARRKAMGHEW